jgi:hypothetical protein
MTMPDSPLHVALAVAVTDECIPSKVDAKSIQRTPSGSAIQAHALLPSAFSIEEPTRAAHRTSG